MNHLIKDSLVIFEIIFNTWFFCTHRKSQSPVAVICLKTSVTFVVFIWRYFGKVSNRVMWEVQISAICCVHDVYLMVPIYDYVEYFSWARITIMTLLWRCYEKQNVIRYDELDMLAHIFTLIHMFRGNLYFQGVVNTVFY